jgi:hypothetical protein
MIRNGWMNRFSYLWRLGYLWILVFAVGLCWDGFCVLQRSTSVAEYASGCDSFGYLSMARKFRNSQKSFYPGFGLPDFSIQDQHIRKLIGLLKSLKFPSEEWNELVAPHAHHYFAKTDQVGPQYPPGTGWILSFFPEGKAIEELNRINSFFLVGFGLLGLGFAFLKRLWVSAGWFALVMYWNLDILNRMDNASFSINALMIPLSLSILLIFFSRNRAQALSYGSRLSSNMLLFLAGCFFGLSVFIRLPLALLYPGLMVLVFDRSPFVQSKTSCSGVFRFFKNPFHIGMGLFIFPLMLQQHQLAGAWYLSTYSDSDNSLPSTPAN